jgi:hypothetical protein
MIASQYPGAASEAAYLPAACELPEKKCVIRTTLSRVALRVP